MPDSALRAAKFQSRLKLFALLFCWFILLLSGLTLGGWLTGSIRLVLPIEGLAPMNPLTSVCFVLLACSLLLYRRNQKSADRVAQIMAGIALVLGFLRVFFLLSGNDLNADTWIAGDVMRAVPNSRMSYSASINFTLAGFALLFKRSKFSDNMRPAQYLMVIVGLWGILTLLGYLYDVYGFYHLLSGTPMSFQAGTLFVLLALAFLFSDPDAGMMRKYTSPYSGSLVAPKLMPAALLIPFLLGLVNLIAIHADVYSPEYGYALMTLGVMCTFVVLISITVTLLNRQDLLRKQAQEEILRLNETLEKRIRERTEELQQRDAQLRLFIENSPAALAMFDNEMRYLVVSKSWLKDYNIQEKDIIGKTHYEVFPTIPERWKEIHRRCLNGATEKNNLDSFIAEDGSIVYNRWEIRPWQNPSGAIGGIIMFTQVITEAVQAELKFKDLVRNSMVGVFIVADRKFDYVNARLCEILGYDAEEFLGKDATMFIHPEDRWILEGNWTRREGGEDFSVQYEARGITKSGQEIWLDIVSNATVYSGKRGVIGTVNDITAKKKAEQELRQSEANLRSVFSNTEIGYLLLDREYNIIAFNEIMERKYAHDAGITLVPGGNFVELAVPERREILREIYQRVITEGTRQEYDAVVPGRDDTFYNVLQVPVKSGDRVIGISISAFDISKRKMLEQERLRITNDLIQRNTDLEQFAYIVSHNLRAPVANIIGLMNLVKMGTVAGTELEKVNSGLFESVQRLDTVVKDLNSILQVKQYLRKTREEVNFESLVQDIRASIANLIDPAQVIFHCDFASAPSMLTLKSYLHSIFYNLITNSIKYRKSTEPCRISITSRRDGKYLELVFADNGLGIDLKHAGANLFGLYKKFHMDIDGKGMGLFMVKTQTEVLGGTISVESEVGKGTRFTIRFEA